ncbi:hypothetical protein [Nocardia gamkensis]|uniref:DUF3291 domain-containing protein n=1 Tax=Nocardia gamkensis TaxID=352869 RepID=A0A7X6L0K0_9NOCA|nr:hypothetical protein [Nocardia gamkensis]NKY25634.1 hypothetical protein [Nocardia gamkensis]NQE66505.1 hypothetical protein [Nocardia gamkensis]
MLTNSSDHQTADRSSGTGEQPFSAGTMLMPWQAGPRHDTPGPVFVSVTDFLASSEEDVQEIYKTGMRLGRTWPVMHGAVGLWLWGRPSEARGGSISVWETEQDMRRFVRWPVHTDIMRKWRGRVRVATDSWQAPGFEVQEVWARASNTIDLRPHPQAG